ncbi:MAG: DUF3310 domain-containing protein [Novipirellula sp. JB048]
MNRVANRGMKSFEHCDHISMTSDPKRRQMVCNNCGGTLADGRDGWMPPPVKPDSFSEPAPKLDGVESVKCGSPAHRSGEDYCNACWPGTVDDEPDCEEPEQDLVNHPPHYTSHPSGIECIQVCEHFPFSIGNVIKYLWRSEMKGDAIEDLQKARWYLDREITRRTQSQSHLKDQHINPTA